MLKMEFLGYFKIKDLPKEHYLEEYQRLIGSVCKLYKADGIDELICDVKGHFNFKSKYGLFYLPLMYEQKFYFDSRLKVDYYDLDCLEEITSYEYENYIPEMKVIYLIKGFHPKDPNKKTYTFKSNQSIKENTKVIVDTKFDEQELIVTDCKVILEDQENEYLEKLQLKNFRKVLSVLEEVEVVKKEIKEKIIEWDD